MVDATPKGNTARIAVIEPASDHPHFLLCIANTPPAMGNTVWMIDSIKAPIRMVFTKDATIVNIKCVYGWVTTCLERGSHAGQNKMS